MERTRHSFRHAGMAERFAALAIAFEMDIPEIEAWRKYVKGEELPQFFEDFADNCGEICEDFVENVLERTGGSGLGPREKRRIGDAGGCDSETAGAGKQAR